MGGRLVRRIAKPRTIPASSGWFKMPESMAYMSSVRVSKETVMGMRAGIGQLMEVRLMRIFHGRRKILALLLVLPFLGFMTFRTVNKGSEVVNPADTINLETD